jgi:monoamine oxidase
MLDTAIVGGGLCGVVLARSLCQQGREVALFEARQRLGGRVLSVARAGAGPTMDLGPSWFWPDTQPLLTGLIAELGLIDIPQHDDGSMLHMHDPDKMPERIDGEKPYEGAHRLLAGMGQLIDALAADLPPSLTYLNHVLTGVCDRGDHVVLTLEVADNIVEIAARHVVLAAPPRLLAERVRFEPELDEVTREAMHNAQTWMATQAKVAIGYDRAFWREAGQSGNASVTHEQAVIGEIFDICDGDPLKAALAGFIALSPDLRASFKDGLPMLVDSQLVQLFGLALDHGEQRYQDWATESYTCSARDRASPPNPRVEAASPMLRRAQWDGRLYIGGAETASRSAGYLEGALDAARRIDLSLGRNWTREQPSLSHPLAAGDSTASVNAESLAGFRRWVAAQGDAVFDDYRHCLNRSLAAQQREQLTQRAILEAMEEVFDKALAVLKDLVLDVGAATVESGRSSLTPDVQRPFGDLMRSVLDDVIAFNRTSCALSNCPDEHRLSNEYLQVILRDIAAAWLEFSLSANRLLLAKAEGDARSEASRLTGVAP